MELSKLPPHPQHDVSLEQYATEGDFAARWIAEIIDQGDINENTRVVDLGAGNGILGIGCLLAGAKSVLLVEIDPHCHHEYDGVEWLIGDVRDWSGEDVELVIMNPPWGVQTPKADRPFLETVFNSDATVAYVLHSSHSTHLCSIANSMCWSGEIVLSGTFRIPANYQHHQSKNGVTDVSVWRFIRD